MDSENQDQLINIKNSNIPATPVPMTQGTSVGGNDPRASTADITNGTSIRQIVKIAESTKNIESNQFTFSKGSFS